MYVYGCYGIKFTVGNSRVQQPCEIDPSLSLSYLLFHHVHRKYWPLTYFLVSNISQTEDQEDLLPTTTPGELTPSPLFRPCSRRRSLGYKPTAAKTVDEYNNLDAEDESLARWKASLGLGAKAVTTATGPKVNN